MGIKHRSQTSAGTEVPSEAYHLLDLYLRSTTTTIALLVSHNQQPLVNMVLEDSDMDMVIPEIEVTVSLALLRNFLTVYVLHFCGTSSTLNFRF